MRWFLRWLRNCWHRDLIWRLEVIEARLTVQSAVLAKTRVDLTRLLKEVAMSQAREIDKGKRPGAKPSDAGAGAGGGSKK